MQAGIILPQKYAAALGMEPREFERQMQEAKQRICGWTHAHSHGLTNGCVKDNGAPKKSDSEISESGSQTRDDGEFGKRWKKLGLDNSIVI